MIGTTSFGDNPHLYAFNNQQFNINITFDLCQSSYDTVFSVTPYPMPLPSYTNDNDTNCIGGGSYIDAKQVPPNLYILEINGFGGKTGTYNLNIACSF